MSQQILNGLNKVSGNIANSTFFGQPLPDQMRKAINKAKKVIVNMPKNNVNKTKKAK